MGRKKNRIDEVLEEMKFSKKEADAFKKILAITKSEQMDDTVDAKAEIYEIIKELGTK